MYTLVHRPDEAANRTGADRLPRTLDEANMLLLDGKATAAAIRAELKLEVEELTRKIGRPPCLAVVLVGEDPASQVYVRNKEKACADVGVKSEAYRPPADMTQPDLEELVKNLCGRKDVDGVLVQLPLPKGLDARRIIDRIDPSKDVDGFTPASMGRLALGLPGLKPCTPWGVIELLRRHHLSTSGKRAVVIGRSNIVGKPLAMLLAQPGPQGDATVTVCHTKTSDLKAECLRADFIFAAVGVPNCVTADMVKDGAVVVDVGISRTPSGLVGDVDFEGLKDKVAAMTPVPGGVGPMTIAMLLKNTVQACKARLSA